MTGIPGVSGGLKELTEAVLGRESCAACGACVGLCPYIQCVEDRVAAVADCRKTEGRCYFFCPRVHSPEAVATGAEVLGSAQEIGEFRRALQGRGAAGDAGPAGGGRVAAADAPSGAGVQHGGVVTALLLQAFRSQLIGAAVLTRIRRGRLPETFVARSEADVLSAVGSKFAVAPTVAEVNRAVAREDLAGVPLGVVALPCQAAALQRIRTLKAARDAALAATGEDAVGSRDAAAGPAWLERPFPNVALVIGLFCTWALTQRGWLSLLEGALGSGPQYPAGSEAPAFVRRADIPPPPANILEIEFADGSLTQVSLDEVRPHIREGCRLCADMTSEHADVSVGLVEGREGWNTVIARSEAGDTLVRAAEASGLIEVEPLDSERLSHLADASDGKRRRALETAADRNLDLPYLRQPGEKRSEDA